MILIPILITLFFLFLLFRPFKNEYGQGDIIGQLFYSLNGLARFFYAIPILLTWVIYLALKLIF